MKLRGTGVRKERAKLGRNEDEDGIAVLEISM
jgi:hypothetical protein